MVPLLALASRMTGSGEQTPAASRPDPSNNLGLMGRSVKAANEKPTEPSIIAPQNAIRDDDNDIVAADTTTLLQKIVDMLTRLNVIHGVQLRSDQSQIRGEREDALERIQDRDNRPNLFDSAMQGNRRSQVGLMGMAIAGLMAAMGSVREAMASTIQVVTNVLPAPIVRERSGGSPASQVTDQEDSDSGRRASPADTRGSRFQNGTLSLSDQDIEYLMRTVATEWVPSAGTDQLRGIVDTILNRVASGRWGRTVESVVNARSQFSDVNGRPAWQRGRNRVSQIPAGRASARVRSLVRQYLIERQNGRPSIVGDNLNYANLQYSDQRNRGWISRLNGPRLGRGSAIHRHGTTPDLQRHRPGRFNIRVGSPPRGTVRVLEASTQPRIRATGRVASVTPRVRSAQPATALAQGSVPRAVTINQRAQQADSFPLVRTASVQSVAASYRSHFTGAQPQAVAPNRRPTDAYRDYFGTA